MLNPNVNYRPNHKIIRANGCYQFQYFCFLCDYCYTTVWIASNSEDEALLLSEKEARRHFNGCHNCGRWVCDAHYNIDEMMCVECAPPSEQNVIEKCKKENVWQK